MITREQLKDLAKAKGVRRGRNKKNTILNLRLAGVNIESEIMTSKEYTERVNKLGSISSVAKRLGITRETLSKRCHGHYPIGKEAALAIKQLYGS